MCYVLEKLPQVTKGNTYQRNWHSNKEYHFDASKIFFDTIFIMRNLHVNFDILKNISLLALMFDQYCFLSQFKSAYNHKYMILVLSLF